MEEDEAGQIMARAFMDERRKMEEDMTKTPRIASPVAQAEMRGLLGRVFPNRNLSQQEQALERMSELQAEIDSLKTERAALQAENLRLREQLQRAQAQQAQPRAPMPIAPPIAPTVPRPVAQTPQAAPPAKEPEKQEEEEDPSSARFRLLELD